MLLVDGGIGLIKLSLLRSLKKLGYDVRPPLRNLVNLARPATDEEAKTTAYHVSFAFRCPA